MIHKLKIDKPVFQAVADGLKTFEIRKNDRGFKVGDELHLSETLHTAAGMANGLPLEYTGRIIAVKVTYILHGPAYGIGDGFVVMSIVKA